MHAPCTRSCGRTERTSFTDRSSRKRTKWRSSRCAIATVTCWGSGRRGEEANARTRHRPPHKRRAGIHRRAAGPGGDALRGHLAARVDHSATGRRESTGKPEIRPQRAGLPDVYRHTHVRRSREARSTPMGIGTDPQRAGGAVGDRRSGRLLWRLRSRLEAGTRHPPCGSRSSTECRRHAPEAAFHVLRKSPDTSLAGSASRRSGRELPDVGTYREVERGGRTTEGGYAMTCPVCKAPVGRSAFLAASGLSGIVCDACGAKLAATFESRLRLTGGGV